MSTFRAPSLTFRLTLLFSVVSSAVLLVLGLIVGGLVERHFEEMDLDLLEGKVELVKDALGRMHDENDSQGLAAMLDAALVGDHGMAVAIWKPSGEALYATEEGWFPESVHDARHSGGWQPLRWQGPDGRTYRGITAATSIDFGQKIPLTVAVSTDLAHHEHFMHAFQATLWQVVGVAAFVSGLLGWWVARRGLAPLRAISRDAAAITANRLDQRLSAEAIPVELADVVGTLNAMLARLEESFRRLSDFSSDLAHELRTPVSNLLTQTQVTLGKARTAGEYEDVLVSNIEEFERLSKMIGDMLFLAKADNKQVLPALETVDLRHEADDLAEFYQPVAEERGIALLVQGSAAAQCDRLMMRRAIGNLVSNALRYSIPGGQVLVRLASDRGGVSVTVENHGETIPPEHLARLFDRFYRADPSRQRHTEGVGLGLAITRSILRAHGGEASAESTGGVTRFTLSLPA